MKKITSVLGIAFYVCVLLTTTISCNSSELDNLNPDVDNMPLLELMLRNGKTALRIEYNADKRIKSIYEYDDSLNVKQPAQRIDYGYDADGQVNNEKVFNLRTGQLASDSRVVYEKDTIFLYENNKVTAKMAIIRPNKVTRTGDLDTVIHSSYWRSINYSLYTREGDDLVKLYASEFHRDFSGSSHLEYEEKYSYDTTLNPLWPIIANSPYFARAFLKVKYRFSLPFAYTLSRHNPLTLDLTHYQSGLSPSEIAFEYSFLPGYRPPFERKWINRKNGSVYQTDRFLYRP